MVTAGDSQGQKGHEAKAGLLTLQRAHEFGHFFIHACESRNMST